MSDPLSKIGRMSERTFAELVEGLDLGADGRAALVELWAVVVGSSRADVASGPELGAVLQAGARLAGRIEGFLVPVQDRFVTSGQWEVEGSRSPAAWVGRHTSVFTGRAGKDLARAAVLSGCPHITAALRAGRLTGDQVTLLLGVRKADLEDVFAFAEAKLIDLIAGETLAVARRRLASWELEVRELLGRPDPDAHDPDRDPDHFRLRRTMDGRHVADGQFGPESAVALEAAIAARIKRWRDNGELDGDHRSLAELQAAALLDLVSCASEAVQPGRGAVLAIIDYDTLTRRDRTRVGTDPVASDVPSDPGTEPDPAGPRGPAMPFRSELAGHGPIDPEALRQLCCNADISRVILRGDSEILDVGRAERLATPAIRRAVWTRSGGICEGCRHVKLDWCQLHHIDWWTEGGATTVENSLLVCRHCHNLIHRRGFTVHRNPDGTYQLLRPDRRDRAGPDAA